MSEQRPCSARTPPTEIDTTALATQIKQWGRELGFQAVGITDTDLATHERYLARWLEAGHHGEMAYMAKHGTKRTVPPNWSPAPCA